MSDPKRPTETPPDLPPEYAEAYRRGYERAYREAAGGPDLPGQRGPEDTEETLVDVPRVRPEPPPPSDEAPTHAAAPAPEEPDAFDRLFAPREAEDRAEEPGPEPEHRGEPRPERERPRWLVPVLLAALVVALLLGAYGVGRVFSSSVEGTDVSTGKPDGVEVGGTPSGADDTADGGGDGDQVEPKPYRGRVNSATIGGSSASCQSPSSVDAAGNAVRYPPANMHDGDLSTAWRCNGDGVGETVTLTLPGQIRIGEVGLVPGYAKTDPRNGADRYAENNRITKVRWTFPGGASFVQTLDGSPENRSMQTRRIPVTKAGEVTIEILDSVSGPRNTVAISEVRIAEAVG